MAMVSSRQFRNRLGLFITILEESDGPCRVRVGGREMSMAIDAKQLYAGLDRWIFQNEYLQNALSSLNADEREFLLTGLTPAEFDLLNRDVCEHGYADTYNCRACNPDGPSTRTYES